MSQEEWMIFAIIQTILLIPVLFFKTKEDD
jgi:hypothetical protein